MLMRLIFLGPMLLLPACEPLPGAHADGGTDGAGAAGGVVTMKSATFQGTAASGRFTVVLANDSAQRIGALTEAHVLTDSGELVFLGACTACTTADGWCVGGGAAASFTLDVAQLDTTGRGAIGTTCKGSPYALGVRSDSPAAATSDVPRSLTLKGAYPDGTPWTATSAVQ